MNLKDVPNDKGYFRGREELRKIVYATRDDGTYTTANSDGWEVENMATRQAWDNVEAELSRIRQEIAAGRLSPVPYYMCKSLMELSVLASYMGKWKWQVKRHFLPRHFKKLPARTLQRYCTVFNISMEELTDVDHLITR